MSEMVERVASVLQGAGIEGISMDEARAYARLAIEAMREPTPAMRLNGGAEVAHKDTAAFPGNSCIVTANRTWESMISAALA